MRFTTGSRSIHMTGVRRIEEFREGPPTFRQPSTKNCGGNSVWQSFDSSCRSPDAWVDHPHSDRPLSHLVRPSNRLTTTTAINCDHPAHFFVVGSASSAAPQCWRRGWDSNPRAGLPRPSDFESAPLWPLRYLSGRGRILSAKEPWVACGGQAVECSWWRPSGTSCVSPS